MLICNKGCGMGSPLSIVFLLVMLQALHVFCVQIDRGRDTTSEERNKTKAELHGQGTEVTPMQNAAVTVKEEWSRRPPGMAVEEDDKRWSHDTGNTTTNTTLLYPPAQHHSDSSNAPETRKPAALTDQRLKKLEDWSGKLSDKSSMTSDGRDTGEEKSRSGKLSGKSAMTSDGRDTGEEKSRSGKLSDMTSGDRDTGEEKSRSGKLSDMTSDARDTGEEKSRSGKLSDMTSDGRDTGEEKSRSGKLSDMTSGDRDTGEEKSRSGKLSDMTSGDRDTGEEKSRSGKLSDMTSDDRDTGEEKSRSGKLSGKSSMTSNGRDTGVEKSRSGKLSGKSPVTPDDRDTGEKRSWFAREATKQQHWQDAGQGNTTTAWREEDVRQRMERLKTMNHNERLKTMNHNERMERLKTMHLNVSSARRDDKVERRGVTKRSWEHYDEHAQRKMRKSTTNYGRTEIQEYYDQLSCCKVCTLPPTRSNRADVAYKKPVSSSPLHAVDERACACNNGNMSSSYASRSLPSPNGCHSSTTGTRHWWLVDLVDHFTIPSVTMVLRGTAPESDNRRMYNTLVTIDGVECYNFGTDSTKLQNLTATNDYTCKTTVRGRYVMVQKKDDPIGTGDWCLLIFMELLIYACLPGHYWVESRSICAPCVSPCKYICDNINGCNTILKYNVVSRLSSVTMSTLDHGTPTSTTDGRVVSALTANYQECVGTGSGLGYRFWRVDLNNTFHIFEFVVTPSTNFNSTSMTNMIFLVMRNLENLATTYHAGPTELCHTFTGRFQGSRQSVPCDRQPLFGSLVGIQAPQSSSLSLCEVEVMGYSVIEIGVGGTGCGELETSFCEERFVCDNKTCKIPIGGNCAKRSWTGFCQSRSTCDGGICKLMLHQNCSATTERHQCKFGTECDPTASFQCRTVPGGACETANDCSRSVNYTCDALSRCRLKQGKACLQVAECVAGATCESFSCQCNNTVAQTNGMVCQAKAGYAAGSCNTTTVCTAHATCHSNKCRCDDGYEVFPLTFTCTHSAGINSNCSTQVPCAGTLICDVNKCKLDLKARCLKHTDCRNETWCDVATSSCRLRVGSQCQESDPSGCSTGMVCNGGTCGLQFGEGCTASDDKCSASTKCSMNAFNVVPVCLLEEGQRCFRENKTMCKNGTVCDKDIICKIQGGGQCDSNNAKYCRLGTTCEGGLCVLIRGASCQTNGTQCLPGLGCDSLGECRIPENADCSKWPAGCLAGATCNSTDHTCHCQTENCNPGSGKIGSNCTITELDGLMNTSCKDPFAICDRHLGVCQCSDKYGTIRANFTCGQGAGSICNSSQPCPAGLLCDSRDTCAVEVGESCEGRKVPYCRRGTICDRDEFCRLTLDENCENQTDTCELGLRCDSSGACKVPLDETCSYDKECEAGSSCNFTTRLCTCTGGVSEPSGQGPGCEPIQGRVGGECNDATEKCLDANAVCNNQTCGCSPGYKVNHVDFTCSTDLGGTCEKDEECGPRASCDSLKKCSLSRGQSCRGKLREHCSPLEICDKTDVCKIRSQGICDRIDLLPCEAGMFCDWLGICSLNAGSKCNSTSLCPAGALCVDKSCQCDENKAVSYDVICRPRRGRVLSDCEPVNKPCTVPGAKCMDGICRCAAGLATRDFTCSGQSQAQQKPDEQSGSSVGMIVGLSVGLGLVVLIAGAAFVHTRRPPGLDWDTEAKARKKSLGQLQGLADDVEETGVGDVEDDDDEDDEDDEDVRAKDVEKKDVENKDVGDKDVGVEEVDAEDDDAEDDDDEDDDDEDNDAHGGEGQGLPDKLEPTPQTQSSPKLPDGTEKDVQEPQTLPKGGSTT